MSWNASPPAPKSGSGGRESPVRAWSCPPRHADRRADGAQPYGTASSPPALALVCVDAAGRDRHRRGNGDRPRARRGTRRGRSRGGHRLSRQSDGAADRRARSRPPADRFASSVATCADRDRGRAGGDRRRSLRTRRRHLLSRRADRLRALRRARPRRHSTVSWPRTCGERSSRHRPPRAGWSSRATAAGSCSPPRSPRAAGSKGPRPMG